MSDGPEPGTTLEQVERALSDRAVFEQSLDDLVSNNRFTIAVVFPVVGAITLLASAEGLLPDPLAFNPYFVLVGVFVMRLPLISGLAPLVDRKAGIALGTLISYTYAIEYVGATTGLPYGEFSYVVSLGPMLFGTIPYALPLFFIPLVVNSYLLTVLLLGERANRAVIRLPIVAATVVAIDLVLDPAAVALGFWTFSDGVFYGVPVINYAGWILSAVVATICIDIAFPRAALLDRITGCEYMLDDMVSFVLLWGTINVFYGAWIPAAIAGLFGLSLLRLDRFDFDIAGTVPGL